MFVFNFGVGSLEQSVGFVLCLYWVCSNFSISLTILFSKNYFFQTDNQKAVLFTAFSLFELLTYLKRRPLFRSQISNFFATSKAGI